MLVEDTSYSVAIPILEYVPRARRLQDSRHCRPHRRSDRHRPADVTVELERLVDAGFVKGPLHQYLSGGDFSVWSLEEASLAERVGVVGAWPSDDPYDLEGTLRLRARPQAAFVKVQTSDIISSSGTLSDAAPRGIERLHREAKEKHREFGQQPAPS